MESAKASGLQESRSRAASHGGWGQGDAYLNRMFASGPDCVQVCQATASVVTTAKTAMRSPHTLPLHPVDYDGDVAEGSAASRSLSRNQLARTAFQTPLSNGVPVQFNVPVRTPPTSMTAPAAGSEKPMGNACSSDSSGLELNSSFPRPCELVVI